MDEPASALPPGAVVGERLGPHPQRHCFELWSAAAGLALSATYWLDPVRKQVAFGLNVFRPGEQLVTLLAGARLPARGLELRADGLWVDANLETPYEHWSVGLEAFGLAVEDPTDDRGLRVPVGMELDWEHDRAVTGGLRDGYEQPARVRGEVLLGTDTYELDVIGWRSHQLLAGLGAYPTWHGCSPGEAPGQFTDIRWTQPVASALPQPWGWGLGQGDFGGARMAPWFEEPDAGATVQPAGFWEQVTLDSTH
ncbi:MAG: hypothetical protein ACKV2O_13030 [Acidimicrobiales bacterium]